MARRGPYPADDFDALKSGGAAGEASGGFPDIGRPGGFLAGVWRRVDGVAGRVIAVPAAIVLSVVAVLLFHQVGQAKRSHHNQMYLKDRVSAVATFARPFQHPELTVRGAKVPTQSGGRTSFRYLRSPGYISAGDMFWDRALDTTAAGMKAIGFLSPMLVVIFLIRRRDEDEVAVVGLGPAEVSAMTASADERQLSVGAMARARQTRRHSAPRKPCSVDCAPDRGGMRHETCGCRNQSRSSGMTLSRLGFLAKVLLVFAIAGPLVGLVLFSIGVGVLAVLDGRPDGMWLTPMFLLYGVIFAHYMGLTSALIAGAVGAGVAGSVGRMAWGAPLVGGLVSLAVATWQGTVWLPKGLDEPGTVASVDTRAAGFFVVMAIVHIGSAAASWGLVRLFGVKVPP